MVEKTLKAKQAKTITNLPNICQKIQTFQINIELKRGKKRQTNAREDVTTNQHVTGGGRRDITSTPIVCTVYTHSQWAFINNYFDVNESKKKKKEQKKGLLLFRDNNKQQSL